MIKSKDFLVLLVMNKACKIYRDQKKQKILKMKRLKSV